MPRYLPVFSCHFSCFPDLPSGIIFLQPEWHLDWNFSLNYAAITYDYKISLACNNKDFFFSHIYAYGGLTTAMFNVLFISGSKLKEQLLSRTTVLKILLRSITSEWHVASTHTQSANKVIWLNLITLRHESQLEIVGKPSDINKIFPTFFFLFFFLTFPLDSVCWWRTQYLSAWKMSFIYWHFPGMQFSGYFFLSEQ